MWRQVKRGERIEEGRLAKRRLYASQIITVSMQIKNIPDNIDDDEKLWQINF